MYCKVFGAILHEENYFQIAYDSSKVMDAVNILYENGTHQGDFKNKTNKPVYRN